MSKEGSLSNQADAWLQKTIVQGQWQTLRYQDDRFRFLPTLYAPIETADYYPFAEAKTILLGIFEVSRSQTGVQDALIMLIHHNHPDKRIFPLDVIPIAQQAAKHVKIMMLAEHHNQVSDEVILSTALSVAFQLQLSLSNHSMINKEYGVKFAKDNSTFEQPSTEKLFTDMINFLIAIDSQLLEDGFPGSYFCEYVLGIGPDKKRKITGIKEIDEVFDQLNAYMYTVTPQKFAKDNTIPTSEFVHIIKNDIDDVVRLYNFYAPADRKAEVPQKFQKRPSLHRR